MRTCGGCSKCCETVPVKEIGVKPFQRCPNMRDVLHVAGPGCAVYPDRPYSCAAWRCLWLKSETTLGEDMRPDRCGLVFDEIVDMIRVGGKEMPAAQVWVSAGHERDFDTVESVRQAVCALLDQKLAVLWRMPGDMALAIYRGADGKFYVSQPHQVTETLGPDAQRLARAADLYDMAVADG